MTGRDTSARAEAAGHDDPLPGEGNVTDLPGSALGGAGFLLGAAHRLRRRRWEASLADLGLTAPQAAVLRLVVARPGQGVRRLAHELSTDPMNTQRIVETLVTARLCEARRDPADARRRPIHPTPRGRQLAETVATRADQVERTLADALGAARYQALLAGLEALRAHDGGQVLSPPVLRQRK